MSETFVPSFLGGEPDDAAPAADANAATSQPAAEAAPAADAPAAAPEAPVAEGQQRGPDGKFVAATPAAEPAPQAAPAAEAPPAQPEPLAPIAALLDERDKRQAAERRAEASEVRARELQAWRDQQEAAARRQPIPSREENPVAWEQHREALIQNELRNIRLTSSRQIAEVKHGEDVVTKAYDWGFERCATDPYFNAKVAAAADPVSLVVAEWKREQAAQVDPKEFEAFQQWKAAQGAAPAQAPQPQAQPPAAPLAAPAAPRPSLAAGPSAGRADAAQPGDAEAVFDGMFRK